MCILHFSTSPFGLATRHLSPLTQVRLVTQSLSLQLSTKRGLLQTGLSWEPLLDSRGGGERTGSREAGGELREQKVKRGQSQEGKGALLNAAAEAGENYWV